MPRFSETLLDHARNPRAFGRDGSANTVGISSFGGRPPTIELYLRVEEDIIVKASFHATGCGVAIATGSVLTEMIFNQQVCECARIQSSDICDELNGIPSDKRFCAEVTIAALKNALDNFAELAKRTL